MKLKEYIWRHDSTITIVLSVLFFLLSMITSLFSENREHVAKVAQTKIEKRIAVLDKYVGMALEQDSGEWMQMDLPEDMVIYRYAYDTLSSWCNQFPILNDDISSKVVFQRLSNLRSNLISPLGSVTEQVQFLNLGARWFLVKAVSDGVVGKVIAGVEVFGSYAEETTQGKVLKGHICIPKRYDILTLDYSGGTPVYFEGRPLFKIQPKMMNGVYVYVPVNSILRWIALFLLTVSFLLYLRQHRSLRNYIAMMVLIMVAASVGYVWGAAAQDSIPFFSPMIYAGGGFLCSYGVLFILNVAVIFLVVGTYLAREVLYRKIANKRVGVVIYGVMIFVALSGLCVYLCLSFRSLMLNSDIHRALNMWSQIALYTLITYVMYASLLFCALLLLQMFAPVVYHFTGRKFRVFTWRGVTVFAILAAAFFTTTTSLWGFQKEKQMVAVISNRLAVDRDLSLELTLRGVEEAISNDMVIGTLSHMENSDYVILKRLTEAHLNRISQNYDVSVIVSEKNEMSQFAAYEQRLYSGSPIAERSRFIYTYDSNGRSGYLGMFVYYSNDYGLASVLVDISDKALREARGNYSLLSRNSQFGGVNVPAEYSYAKYISGRLTRYRGDFPYPTEALNRFMVNLDEDEEGFVRHGKYLHFVNKVSDDEVIVISRSRNSWITYVVTFSYLMMISILPLWPFVKRRRKQRRQLFRNNYYRSRIQAVLFISLAMTLVVMATLSVTFVYRRNTSNMYSLMSEKITSIQTILEAQLRGVEDIHGVNSNELASLLESVGSDMKADITMYAPNGKVYLSTTPEVFERMEMGSRMNEEAYYNIVYEKQRFFINAEQIEGEKFYSLYVPIINSEGTVVAIVSVPYTEQNLEFKSDALFHAVTFVNVFLILIFITLLISSTIVKNLFAPLVEIGHKMNSADLGGMEYIIYKRKDEVSTLVDAYNRMVHDLYQSMKQVTQAERDKAWSEMARQVAHEIKNPLTPIKLELQRLIRLKQRNDASWEEKFDKVSAIVLEHIDILTDTANEFSTFAKLYTEENVLIDLDKTLRDQVMIFDNKENITMDYIGLEGACVMAPRPQLIRVFVNLITNAVQAVEENGVEQGRIMVSLRNGVKDGYYDIVVEDNGLGVKEENQSRLFTPNFTTKSSGTGLGLAICKNIVEKCNGRIVYQRSFSLGGAAFVVSLPKNSPTASPL